MMNVRKRLYGRYDEREGKSVSKAGMMNVKGWTLRCLKQ